MEWIEVSIAVDNESVEAASAFLARFGSIAVEELHATPLSGDSFPPQVTVYCYLTRETAERSYKAIEEGLWHLSQLLPLGQPRCKVITEQEWMEAWKEHYPLVRISEHMVVVPTWQQYLSQPGEVVLTVDPGMAFGTGLHPSTQLCLKAIELFLHPGDTVLDVGTGTGILAIAAAKLGAASVLAIDIDEAAVKAAHHNAAANSVADKVTVSLASVLPRESIRGIAPIVIDTGAYDLILANIIAEVIAQMAPALARLARPGATIVTSGIIKEREHLVGEAFAGKADTIHRAQDGDWVCLCFRPPS
ncbi:MAG: 50S ribosomal protein L11 methyltransferase [Anaerolineae bacterium]